VGDVDVDVVELHRMGGGRRDWKRGWDGVLGKWDQDALVNGLDLDLDEQDQGRS